MFISFLVSIFIGTFTGFITSLNFSTLFILSQGGIAGTVVDLKLLFSVALKCVASGIIIFHNHPSGTTIPSTSDIKLTNKIKQAGEMLDIKLLDHIILTKKGYYSFADEGKI